MLSNDADVAGGGLFFKRQDPAILSLGTEEGNRGIYLSMIPGRYS